MLDVHAQQEGNASKQDTKILLKVRSSDCRSVALYSQGICITSVSEITEHSNRSTSNSLGKRVNSFAMVTSLPYINVKYHANLPAQIDGHSRSQSSATSAIT